LLSSFGEAIGGSRRAFASMIAGVKKAQPRIGEGRGARVFAAITGKTS
jgi:hypothetical protein